jgi:maleylpyruvate isomerase
MNLYTFFRSGTSHRLRIALNLKNVSANHIPIDLRIDQQTSSEYLKVNPQGLVPALMIDHKVLIQSPAIIEWLEESYPNPPFLPNNPFDRAHVRAMASIVACDIHPINNRRILEYLKRELLANDVVLNKWCSRWISSGFDALESILQNDNRTGKFIFGDSPSLADIYLVPQVESARRFKIDVQKWPMIFEIDKRCSSIEEFSLAMPSKQIDAS